MSNSMHIRSRKLRGRKAATAVAFAFFVTMLGPTLPTPLYPIYQNAMGFGGLMVTSIFATYVIGITLSLVLFGRLSDQIGRCAVLIPGLVIGFSSSLVFFLSDGVAWLFVGRILSGLSVGIFTGTATAALLDLAPVEGQKSYSLLAAMVNMLGLGLGPVLAGSLAEYTSAPLTTPYAVHMLLTTIALAGVCLVAEPLKQKRGPFRWEFQEFTLPRETRATFLRAATAGVAGFSVLGLFASVAPALLLHVLGITSHIVCGLVVFEQLAFSALGQLVGTQVTDRRAMIIGTGALVVGVTLIGASIHWASLPALLAGAAIAGTGQGMSFRASLGALAEKSPSHIRGAVTSTFFLVLYVAQAFPVMGIGIAANNYGLASAGTGFAGIIAGIAGCALVSMMQPKQTQ